MKNARNNFDAGLARALQESAREHSALVKNILLKKNFDMPRARLPRRLDKHAPPKPASGHIFQVGTINQFHKKFVSLSKQFGGPNAICGYLSCAFALILEPILKTMPQKALSNSDVQQLCNALTNQTKIDIALKQAFEEIQERRVIFLSSTTSGTSSSCSSSSSSSSSKRKKKKKKINHNKVIGQWVANYEIGDFLERNSTYKNTHFLRMNQWPERGKATVDERPRLEEEARFGGKIVGKDRIAYKDQDSVYFIHSFHPKPPCFRSPEEWEIYQITCSDEGNNSSDHNVVDSPHLVVIDLNGHYVVSVACYLEKNLNNNNNNNKSVEPTLLVFQTTGTNYLSNPAIAFVFDTMFNKECNNNKKMMSQSSFSQQTQMQQLGVGINSSNGIEVIDLISPKKNMM